MPNNDPVAMELFERLSREEHASLRAGVARTPLLDPHVLADLTADPNAMVRQAVAENPRTPDYALEALSAEPGWRMQAALLKNPSTPEGVVSGLASSPAKVVREAVAARREGRSGPGPGALFPSPLPSLVASAAGGSEADLADAVELWAVGLWRPTRKQEQMWASGPAAVRRMLHYFRAEPNERGEAAAGFLLRRWQRGLASAYGAMVEDLCRPSSNGLPSHCEAGRILSGTGVPESEIRAGAGHADPWFRAGCVLHPQGGDAVEDFLGDPDPFVAQCAEDVLWRALAS